MEHLVSNDEPICEMSKFSIIDSNNFDLKQVGIKKHVPKTKQFRIYENRNSMSRKIIRLLCCTHPDCSKVFRKWHNFYDHLRIHTKERPYVCNHPNCGLTFTQKANLNKHAEIHSGKKRFLCTHCTRGFFTKFNLNVSNLPNEYFISILDISINTIQIC